MSGRITLPMAVYTASRRTLRSAPPRRVVLGGDGLAGYRTTGVGDEYIRLLFPAEGTTDPVLPTITDGNLDYGSIDLNLLRTYTVRRFDRARGEVTVDFGKALGHGVATTRAHREPGDRRPNSPTGLYDPPDDPRLADTVSDLAGLPALARLSDRRRRRAHPRGGRGARLADQIALAGAAHHHHQLGARRQRQRGQPAWKRSAQLPCIRTAAHTSVAGETAAHCGPSDGT